MIVNGVHYHFRQCDECGKYYYTTTKRAFPRNLCKDCSNSSATGSISEEEMKLLLEIRNKGNGKKKKYY